MPILRASLTQLPEGAARTRLFAAYVDAFEQALASPRERMRIVLSPLDPACVCVGETPGAGLALLDVYLMPGRSDAQKARLVAALAAATESATGLAGEAFRVLIHDVPAGNLGLGPLTAQARGHGA